MPCGGQGPVLTAPNKSERLKSKEGTKLPVNKYFSLKRGILLYKCVFLLKFDRAFRTYSILHNKLITNTQF